MNTDRGIGTEAAQGGALTPCPFCDGPAMMCDRDLSDYPFWVVCRKCDVAGPRAKSRMEAAEKWNRRASGTHVVMPAGQEPVLVKTSESGWLVERHDRGRIEYLRIDNCREGYAWPTDSLQATRFARRVDAEHAAEVGELDDLRIAEHMWSDTP